MRTHLILYVADQARSTAFYTAVLGLEPTLQVPGMTEFQVGPDTVLGLMPEQGIRRLLALPPAPSQTSRSDVRAEVYLVVDTPQAYHERAIGAGAEELSPLGPRDWGHRVAYSRDPDGYVLAFAMDPAGPAGGRPGPQCQ